MISCEENEQKIKFHSLLPLLFSSELQLTIKSILSKINSSIKYGNFILLEKENKVIFESLLECVFQPINQEDFVEQVSDIINGIFYHFSQINSLIEQAHLVDQKVANYQKITLNAVSSKGKIASFKPLTVDNIKLGLECSRLLYLVYYQGGKSDFYVNSLSSKTNEEFNNLISNFIKNLRNDKEFIALFLSPENLNEETININLQRKFYLKEVYPDKIIPFIKSNNETKSNESKTILISWLLFQELTKVWTKIIVSNINHSDKSYSVTKYLTTNKNLKAIFKYEKKNQFVTGYFSNIFYSLKDKSLVFIHPSTKEVISSQIELTKLALLTHLWREKNKDLIIEKVDYWLLNHEISSQKLTYSWQEIETALTKILKITIPQLQKWLAWQPSHKNPPPKTEYPQLCTICPQKKQCQMLFEFAQFSSIPS